jgi:hypothetical protein
MRHPAGILGSSAILAVPKNISSTTSRAALNVHGVKVEDERRIPRFLENIASGSAARI